MQHKKNSSIFKWAHNGTFPVSIVRGLVRVWVSWIAGATGKELHFRMRIILGTIPAWFLVFYVGDPECSWNSSGECPYLWVLENFV